MSGDKKEQLVFETCKLLVMHFKNLIDFDMAGGTTRIFDQILWRNTDFVCVGKSKEAIDKSEKYVEHIVPCAKLIEESRRLIKSGMASEEIAKLLQKHWKVAIISRHQAQILNSSHKSTMPDGWTFETGDTMQRLKEAGIFETLVN